MRHLLIEYLYAWNKVKHPSKIFTICPKDMAH